MPKLKDIEQVFLGILQDKIDRDEIIQKTRYFKDDHWQCLFGFSIKQDLFPLFYQRLSGLNLENIPPSILSRFKNLYLINLKRCLVLEEELFKIIACLKEHNIAVIPLKGPVLAEILYHNLALRQASFDLDILIKPEAKEEVEEILKELNYHTIFNQNLIELTYRFGLQFRLYKRLKNERSFILDIHWALRGGLSCTHHLQDFWQNARYINLDGQKILMPAYPDLLLYLALVLAYDRFHLKHLFDMHQLIIKYGQELDWPALVYAAKKNRLDKILYFSLKLSQDLFRTKVPEGVSEPLEPIFIKKRLFKYWIKKNVFREYITYGYPWDFFIASYLYSENMLDYAKVIYKKIFKPMAEVMGGYNRPLSSVSYYLYIKRLMRPIIKRR